MGAATALLFASQAASQTALTCPATATIPAFGSVQITMDAGDRLVFANSGGALNITLQGPSNTVDFCGLGTSVHASCNLATFNATSSGAHTIFNDSANSGG